jgi:hypothetical protein
MPYGLRKHLDFAFAGSGNNEAIDAEQQEFDSGVLADMEKAQQAPSALVLRLLYLIDALYKRTLAEGIRRHREQSLRPTALSAAPLHFDENALVDRLGHTRAEIPSVRKTHGLGGSHDDSLLLHRTSLLLRPARYWAGRNDSKRTRAQNKR